MNTQEINKLAMKAKTDKFAFEDLFLELQPNFKKFISSFRSKKNLLGYDFDLQEFESILGISLLDTVAKFDETMGNFTTLFQIFSEKKMLSNVSKNLRLKRFDSEKPTISLDQLVESNSTDCLGGEADEDKTAEKLIHEFITTSSYGKIISVLMSSNNSKVKNQLFTEMFGKYEATERKKVQIARQKLKAYLTLNGVLI